MEEGRDAGGEEKGKEEEVNYIVLLMIGDVG